MVLLRFSGRMLINLSSLSTEGSVGNYNPLQRASVIFRKKLGSKELDVSEVPIITGNMLKHWHAVALRDIEVNRAVKPALCEDCLRGVMMRTRLPLASEHRYIRECVIDDLHGFLFAGEAQERISEGETQEEGTEKIEKISLAIRRESLVKIGNALPVEEHVREGISIDSLIHNRVVIKKTGEVDENYMMPFRREYTSSFFAFYAAADLTYVGVPMSDPYTNDGSLKIVISKSERLRRIELAIDGFMAYFGDVRGAGSSRSLPHTELLESVALIASKKTSMLVSAFYEDYVEQTFMSLSSDDVIVVAYGIDEKIEKLKEKYEGNAEILKILERIHKTETVRDFFRVIKEKSLKLAEQEKVIEISEKEVKDLEKEVKEARKEKKRKKESQ